MKKLTAVIAGCGMRGTAYADYSLNHKDELAITAIAEPNDSRRENAMFFPA